METEALDKIDELLNNIPKTLTSVDDQRRQTRVTFDATTAPPKESVTPTLRQEGLPRPNPQSSIRTALIDKPIQTNVPSSKPQIDVTVFTTPTPRVQSKIGKTPLSIHQQKLRSQLSDKAVSRARIPLRTHMQLRTQSQRERVQLVRDDELGEYFNYRQLRRSVKHKQIWDISSANEFGRLAQGTKDGRVSGTNTIFFISKESVPKDRVRDVTYASFVCEIKPN